MARAPRLIYPDETYHIICRGNNKSSIFHCPEDYAWYLTALEEAKRRYGFSLYHYVLMPNHVHLLLRPNDGGLSESMHVMQMRYAKHYCKKYRFIGHVWHSRFKSLLIENDAYLLACGNYIEMNPVRAGLVTIPDDWGWSSYRYYAHGEDNSIVEADPLFVSFKEIKNDIRAMYRQTLHLTRAI